MRQLDKGLKIVKLASKWLAEEERGGPPERTRQSIGFVNIGAPEETCGRLLLVSRQGYKPAHHNHAAAQAVTPGLIREIHTASRRTF